MNIVEELERLEQLRQKGIISQAEFTELKTDLLQANKSTGRKFQEAVGDTNTWCMLIHLSQFCAYIIPLAGLVVPIILWQIRKDESGLIDQHGRIVANWIISEIIYLLIFGLLCIFIPTF